MSAELTAARKLAEGWEKHGTIDVRTTDADGNPHIEGVIGAEIASDVVKAIREGAPADYLMALTLAIVTLQKNAVTAGYCRQLQRELAGGVA